MNESPDKIIICSTKVLRDLSKYLSSVGSLHLNESKNIKNNYQKKYKFFYIYLLTDNHMFKNSHIINRFNMKSAKKLICFIIYNFSTKRYYSRDNIY